jgi:hypothetical protein
MPAILTVIQRIDLAAVFLFCATPNSAKISRMQRFSPTVSTDEK